MNTYKAKYWYGTAGSTLMNPDDIISMDDDKCYNFTRHLDFSIGDPMEFKKTYLEPLSVSKDFQFSNLDKDFFRPYEGRPNTEEENNSLRIKKILNICL